MMRAAQLHQTCCNSYTKLHILWRLLCSSEWICRILATVNMSAADAMAAAVSQDGSAQG
jgi:hypothetical protein